MSYDARRRLILDAASELFSQRSYSKVSVSDIAEAAGVAKGLLHHYFASKHDLYLEVVRDVARVPVPSDVGEEGEATGGASQTWERSVDAFLRLIADNPELWLRSVRVGGSPGDADVASIVEASREVLADQTIRALGREADGDVPELRALIRGYGGFVQELVLEWLQRGRLDQDQVRTVMLHVMPLLLDQVLPELRGGDTDDDGAEAADDDGVTPRSRGSAAGARRTGGRGARRATAGTGR
jgi:AcrR family transcriptional regulator